MDLLTTNLSKEKKARMPICPECGHQFKYRVKRARSVKYLFFWRTVKRYFCENCVKCHYVFKPQYAD